VALFSVAGVIHRRTRRLQRAARIDEWVGEHRQLPEATLVVLPIDAVVAYATPGSPSQVVVSRGLTRVLRADELDAVVRHELAHLRHRHHRDLALAAVVDAALGWIPGLRASTAALRLGIERSADEEAAERPGAREATRRALLKATETMLAPVPAFTTALTCWRGSTRSRHHRPIRVSGCGLRGSPPSRGSPPWRSPVCWGQVL
jgi:Zn-dependent protease with chaperone function